MQLTQTQARRFLFYLHGLLERRFVGKDGAMAYIRQCGCLQFDPVDVCGQSAQLALHARVENSAGMLHALLYEDRLLFDYPDKQLSIIPIEDWPRFAPGREWARGHLRHYPQLAGLMEVARAHIARNGPVDADSLPVQGDISWWSAIHWSSSQKAARAVLEQMYSMGELVVHHKQRTRKFYDLAARHLPADLLAAPYPFADELARDCWVALRRVGGVGLLWSRFSETWGALDDTDRRAKALAHLCERGELTQVTVEGIKSPMYLRTADLPLLACAMQDHKPRCELLAPLDTLMWDRKLIQALFGFTYSWEIYTPPAKRKYGAYVLPLTYGDRFVGRAEPVVDRKAGKLIVRNIWLEPGGDARALRGAMKECFARLAAFHGVKLAALPRV